MRHYDCKYQLVLRIPDIGTGAEKRWPAVPRSPQFLWKCGMKPKNQLFLLIVVVLDFYFQASGQTSPHKVDEAYQHLYSYLNSLEMPFIKVIYQSWRGRSNSYNNSENSWRKPRKHSRKSFAVLHNKKKSLTFRGKIRIVFPWVVKDLGELTCGHSTWAHVSCVCVITLAAVLHCRFKLLECKAQVEPYANQP